VVPHRADDVDERLFVDSGRDQRCVIATETEYGARIAQPVYEQIKAQLLERKIDVLIIDPFVSSHEVSENDNRAIDAVVKAWGRLADECNCSINLVHHVRKGNGQEATPTAPAAPRRSSTLRAASRSSTA
jgi:RecA-family ATPase